MNRPADSRVARGIGWLLTICGIIWAIWGIAQFCAVLIAAVDDSRTHSGVVLPMSAGLFVIALAAGALWAGWRLRNQ